MKKSILTTLLIAGLAMTTTFADTNTYSGLKAYIKATMNSSDYTFGINYNGGDYGTEATAADESFTLNDENNTTTTNEFIVKTTTEGNLAYDNVVKVTITPAAFLGTSTTATETTTVVPYVVDSLDDNSTITYAAATDATDASFSRTIALGQNDAGISVAEFKLAWTGDNSITAGTYQSTISLAITAN